MALCHHHYYIYYFFIYIQLQSISSRQVIGELGYRILEQFLFNPRNYPRQTIQAALQPVWFCARTTAKWDTLLKILSKLTVAGLAFGTGYNTGLAGSMQ